MIYVNPFALGVAVGVIGTLLIMWAIAWATYSEDEQIKKPRRGGNRSRARKKNL